MKYSIAPPAVSVTATAADLITARLGSTAAERKAALRRVRFDGEAGAVDALVEELHSWISSVSAAGRAARFLSGSTVSPALTWRITSGASSTDSGPT